MVRAFGWSLHEIDETDIESLLPFIFRFTATEAKAPSNGKVYCDQVDWL